MARNLKKMSGRNFATSYENLVATLKMLVAKLIEAILSRTRPCPQDEFVPWGLLLMYIMIII